MITSILLAASFSLLSGLLACLVSICIKLAFSTDLVLAAFQRVSDIGEDERTGAIVIYYLQHTAKLSFIGLALLANSLMWILFSKSLNLSANTLQPTCINKLSNFIASAFFGYFLFDERIYPVSWLCGLALLLVGIIILSGNNIDEQEISSNQQRPVKKERSN